ncbi:helix-turn-helix domain-containing protein [Acidipila sp. EB88]|uniref:helix-turn-helix domain-containing protein n=1 Tax=Acidipila sp. EB88 TaxID=2305226 RepID=UPI001F2BDA38|nr:helix-turn-helix domain-containing protein [Acidipila sp. EB88]
MGGRPKVSEDDALIVQLTQLKAHGKSVRSIAAEVGKSPTTVQKLLRMADRNRAWTWQPTFWSQQDRDTLNADLREMY